MKRCIYVIDAFAKKTCGTLIKDDQKGYCFKHKRVLEEAERLMKVRKDKVDQ